MTDNKLVKEQDGLYQYRGVRISKTKGGWTFRIAKRGVNHFCVVPDNLKNLVKYIDELLNRNDVTVEYFRIVITRNIEVGA